jgi:hypothetical protein
MDSLAGFGRIFLYCTFLPGASVLAALIGIFESQLRCQVFHSEPLMLIGLAFALGIAANAVGHLTELLCNKGQDRTLQKLSVLWTALEGHVKSKDGTLRGDVADVAKFTSVAKFLEF